MDIKSIPEGARHLRLAGRNLPASNLFAISAEPTLLVFLRHFG